MKATHKKILSLLISLSFLFLLDMVLGNLTNHNTVNSFRIKHYYYHHGLKKYTAGTGAWGNYQYRFYTNNLGFRDTTKRIVNVLDSRRKIMILGDSHAEGVGLDYRQCFSGILQEKYPEIQIFNASSESYSPRLHYLKLKWYLENYDQAPSRVLVMIDLSDIQNEIIYKDFRPEDNPMKKAGQLLYEFFHSNSFVYFRFSRIISGIELRKFARESEAFQAYLDDGVFYNTFSLYAGFFDSFNDRQLISDPSFHNTGDWLYNADYDSLVDEGLRIGAENITRLNDLCRSRGIELLISVHPWSEQVMKADTTDRYTEFWRTFCDRQDIEFINLYPYFIYPRFSAGMGGGFFLPNDNHWNAMGHQLVGSALEEELGLTE